MQRASVQGEVAEPSVSLATSDVKVANRKIARAA